MRCIVELHAARSRWDPPLLRVVVHGAPHRRQHYQVISRYRDELVRAAWKAKIIVPIRYKVNFKALFVDPCSPDYDNLFMALCRAMDGSSHTVTTLLDDDGLIYSVKGLDIFYPNDPVKADRPIRINETRHFMVA
jgi:hypothetical protein